MIYGYKRLNKPDDWIDIVGKENWSKEHSAYELAHKWHGSSFPAQVQQVLASASAPFPARLTVGYMLVEKPVFLDTHKAPSMTDIMVYCNMQQADPLIMAVEGKATEKFDLTVKDWISDRTDVPKPTRINRLAFLSGSLGKPIAPDSPLRYQLLHRSVSALLESELHGASSCMLLVHSFSEASKSNWQDYQAFLDFIGMPTAEKNLLQGPVHLGPQENINFFAAWVTDRPKDD